VDWPLLSSLADDERDRVLQTARRRRYARGDIVVHEGEPSDSLHLVAAGRLAVRVSTNAGANATINLLSRGDYFGELSLLDGHPAVRTASIVALEDSETLSLSAAEFRALRRRHPGADRLLVTLLGRRVEELTSRLLEAMYDPLEVRVARRLAELAQEYGDVIPLTQEHLAELVGGTRPSVNQVLKHLEDEGVVRLGRGRVTVLDPGALSRP